MQARIFILLYVTMFGTYLVCGTNGKINHSSLNMDSQQCSSSEVVEVYVSTTRLRRAETWKQTYLDVLAEVRNSNTRPAFKDTVEAACSLSFVHLLNKVNLNNPSSDMVTKESLQVTNSNELLPIKIIENKIKNQLLTETIERVARPQLRNLLSYWEHDDEDEDEDYEPDTEYRQEQSVYKSRHENMEGEKRNNQAKIIRPPTIPEYEDEEGIVPPSNKNYYRYNYGKSVDRVDDDDSLEADYFRNNENAIPHRRKATKPSSGVHVSFMNDDDESEEENEIDRPHKTRKTPSKNYKTETEPRVEQKNVKKFSKLPASATEYGEEEYNIDQPLSSAYQKYKKLNDYLNKVRDIENIPISDVFMNEMFAAPAQQRDTNKTEPKNDKKPESVPLSNDGPIADVDDSDYSCNNKDLGDKGKGNDRKGNEGKGNAGKGNEGNGSAAVNNKGHILNSKDNVLKIGISVIVMNLFYH